MKHIRLVLNKFAQLERWVCSFLLIIMLALLFTQVVLRYCFNSPFSWAEEVTLMFLIWFGYLCMSLDVLTDTHVAIHGIYDKFPKKVKKALDILRHVLLLWFFSQMITYGMKLTNLGLMKKQPASGFSQGWLFAPLVVGGGIMLIFSIVNIISTVVGKENNEERE